MRARTPPGSRNMLLKPMETSTFAPKVSFPQWSQGHSLDFCDTSRTKIITFYFCDTSNEISSILEPKSRFATPLMKSAQFWLAGWLAGWRLAAWLPGCLAAWLPGCQLLPGLPAAPGSSWQLLAAPDSSWQLLANKLPKQRNGHISTPRRPQKLSIGPFDAEFQGGSF